jgi:hypothetical protein
MCIAPTGRWFNAIRDLHAFRSKFGLAENPPLMMEAGAMAPGTLCAIAREAGAT